MQTKTLYRLASLLVVTSLVISTNWMVHAAAPSAASAQSTTDFTFTPVADAYVMQSAPDSNYGASASLRVDNTPLTRSYLRFAIEGLNGSAIQAAKLRIYANSSNNSGYSVYALADNNWTEDTISFNNSPVAGDNLSNSQPFNGGVWTEVDISGYAQSEGTYNLVITTTSDTNTNLGSRESAATAPQLVITSISQEVSTPTSTDMPTLAPTNLPTSTDVPTLAPTDLPTATDVPTLALTDVPTSTSAPSPTATSQAGVDWQPSFPIRAAFYYPWFPQAWTQSGIYPYTNYTPSLDYYNSADLNIVKQHINMMQYGNIQAGISSWWGQGHHTDTKFAGLLSAATGTNFRWSLYYENESQGDPSVSQIQNDLTYIRDHYGNDPSFLRVNGRFVVFVYSDTADACGMADRWKQANTVGAYIVLKVFPGYAACANQPDDWHQYAPAVAADQQGTISYAISPGFWLKGQTVRLARDINRWTQNVKDMVASGAKWQLVTTFSEWGEGTIVEPATEWASASGYGQYLDALHFNGNITVPTQTSGPQPTATKTAVPLPTSTQTLVPQPTATQTSAPLPTSTQPPAPTATKVNTPTATPIPGQSQNLSFIPVADAYVNAASASTNYGGSTSLRVDASPVVKSYLRFSVRGLGGQAISQARLLIYASSSSTQGLVAQAVANNTWGETTLNSTNAPALGNTLASSPAVTGGTWVTLDVTSYVTAEGTFSFGVTTPGSTAISLASRESGANSPKLIVSINGSSTPVVTSTSTSLPTATKTSAPVFTATKTLVPPTATLVGPTATNTPISTYTPVILTKGPTLIYTGDNTRMRIFWQWSSNATFQVQWGTSTSYGLGNVSVSPTDATNHLYIYDISGLTPGTKYYYRVVAGSQYSGGTFYAAPASSATNLKFISYGDTRTNGSVHNGLAGQVISLYQSDPAFQTLNLNVGDWVSGDSESAWTSEWFASSYTNIRTQNANISEIGARGNHEGGATYWKRYWPQPFVSGGLYRSFDYGPMHVAILDQYTAYGAGSAQYNWLKADLAASTKTWKLVVLHEPGWSAGGGHSNNTTVQNDLQPLFQQYGVSIVFGGHNHYYARAVTNGVTHLTMGGGGAPQYAPASGQPNIVKAVQAYSFGQFTISGTTLTAKIVNNSGATIDTFTITK